MRGEIPKSPPFMPSYFILFLITFTNEIKVCSSYNIKKCKRKVNARKIKYLALKNILLQTLHKNMNTRKISQKSGGFMLKLN